jgi:hypothetical protein
MRERKSFAAKMLTGLVIAALLGMGLCGSALVAGEKHPSLSDRLFVVGACVFWPSCVGMVLVVIGVIVANWRERQQ